MIKLDDHIEFANHDSSPIHIASGPHPVHTSLPELDSGDLNHEQTYTFQFVKLGTWSVHNHYDEEKIATIIVFE